MAKNTNKNKVENETNKNKVIAVENASNETVIIVEENFVKMDETDEQKNDGSTATGSAAGTANNEEVQEVQELAEVDDNNNIYIDYFNSEKVTTEEKIKELDTMIKRTQKAEEKYNTLNTVNYNMTKNYYINKGMGDTRTDAMEEALQEIRLLFGKDNYLMVGKLFEVNYNKEFNYSVQIDGEIEYKTAKKIIYTNADSVALCGLAKATKKSKEYKKEVAFDLSVIGNRGAKNWQIKIVEYTDATATKEKAEYIGNDALLFMTKFKKLYVDGYNKDGVFTDTTTADKETIDKIVYGTDDEGNILYRNGNFKSEDIIINKATI